VSDHRCFSSWQDGFIAGSMIKENPQKKLPYPALPSNFLASTKFEWEVQWAKGYARCQNKYGSKNDQCNTQHAGNCATEIEISQQHCGNNANGTVAIRHILNHDDSSIVQNRYRPLQVSFLTMRCWHQHGLIWIKSKSIAGPPWMAERGFLQTHVWPIETNYLFFSRHKIQFRFFNFN
jgi:hypothetical protein